MTMPTFNLRVTRVYAMGERAEIAVEADTIEAALAKAKRYEVDEGLEWFEDERAHDGAEPETYEWFFGDTPIGTGTADFEE